VLKEILRSALGLFYLSGEMITKKTLNGLSEVLRSLSLWPRAALVNARILKSTAFMFSLLPGLEATNVGSLNKDRGSMLGRGIHPLNEVVRGAPGRRQIALTFDAGAGADALPELLAALRDESAKCTFFLIGEWVQRYPNSIKQIVADGHEIGNHSWSHPDLTTLSDRGVSWEITRADAAIQPFYGRSTRPLFRAPFGARNKRVLRVVEALEYRSIYWSLDSLDSVGSPKSSSFIVARITTQPDQVLDGAIVLFHVGNESTARALPEILRILKARHFECVFVSFLIPRLRNNGYGLIKSRLMSTMNHSRIMTWQQHVCLALPSAKSP
jgi:peptidoglycan/xylan/chitin deacetylase (PgdA/CDA1 family)